MSRKWSPPARGFALLGVVFAVAAFALVRSYAARARGMSDSFGPPVRVAVAAQWVPRGTIVHSDLLRIREIPGAFAPPEAISDPRQAEGRVLLAPLRAGEPLTDTRLAPEGVGPVAAEVPPGLRAVAVPTPLIPGTIRPGDHVDVLATFPGVHAHTETVASALQVIRVSRAAGATGPDLSGGAAVGSAGAVLVVLVSPTQAEELAYARAFADLSVAVDGPEEVVATEGP